MCCNVDVISVQKQLNTFADNSAIVMNFHLPEYALYDEIDKVARY